MAFILVWTELRLLFPAESRCSAEEGTTVLIGESDWGRIVLSFSTQTKSFTCSHTESVKSPENASCAEQRLLCTVASPLAFTRLHSRLQKCSILFVSNSSCLSA